MEDAIKDPLELQSPPPGNWIGTKRAAEISGYSRIHLRRLAHLGAVRSWRQGRNILIEEESLRAYVLHMQELGLKSRNPWRTELLDQGRGRTRPNPHAQLPLEDWEDHPCHEAEDE